MKKMGLSRATVQRYFSEAEATGEVVRHGRLGLFRDQRAVNDFDMKRFGLVPKVAVGMNYSLLGSPVFQRVVITKDGPKVKKLHQTERMWVVGKNEFYHKETGRRHFAENTRRRLLLETIEW
ncbi:hypothetical protein KPRYC492_14185 [Klebsiella pneumoniae RYC492]|nr:hypothetical protein KPRYC492_14185 [Klebsiella pneumoniae RYC492]